MALNVIDTSSWQTDLDLGKIDYQAIIVKATQGNGYVNPDCDTKVQQALTAGKKVGFYHFADHGDPIIEADYFYENCLGYIGKGIFVLDWEGVFVNDVAWALAFLNHFKERSGIKALIYMSESVVNSNDWSSVIAADYGLWVAKYADMNPHYNYDMSVANQYPVNITWGSYCETMWQWTSVGRLDGYSGNLDCSIFYGNQDTWDLYAGVQALPPVTPQPIPDPVVTPPVVTPPVVTPPIETPPVLEPPVLNPIPDPLPPIVEPTPPNEPPLTPNLFYRIIRAILAIFGIK